MIPKTRRRWPYYLGAAAALVAGAALLWRSLSYQFGCEELGTNADPALAQRANELLDLLGKDPQRFLDEGTESLKHGPTAEQIVKFKGGLPSVRPARQLRDVWHIKNLSLRSGAPGRALCRVTAPHADTVQLGEGIDETVFLFFETDERPLASRITLQLNLEEGAWRPQYVAILPSRHRGRSAEDFEHLGDEHTAHGRDLEALIAYLAAEKLGRPVTGIETIAFAALEEKLSKRRQPIHLNHLLSPENIPRENSFLQVTMEPSEKDGLLPRVSFVSSRRNEATREDARAIFQSIEKLAPSLRQDFAAVVMTAFEEPPIDPKRSYPNFGTVISFDTQ